MSDTIKFVDYLYSRTNGASGSVLLDINDGIQYCVDEIDSPMPKPRIEWRDPAHGDGKDVSRYKWENREVTLHMHVFGTSDTVLSTNFRALAAQLLKSNPVLMWKVTGWANPLFFDIVSPPDEMNSPDWFETWKREYQAFKVISNLELKLEAQPFLRGPEQTVTLVAAVHNGLAAYDSFEAWDTVHIPTGWTSTQTNAGTVNQDALIVFDGYYSALLTTTAAAHDVAAVTDNNFRAVDATKHYNIQVWGYKDSGTCDLDVDVECFNSGGVSQGILHMLVACNLPAGQWLETCVMYGSPVINPIGGAAPAFPATTTKVKITLRNDAPYASALCVDGVYFGMSEYVPGYEVSGAIGIVAPPALFKGDVPAPADIHLDVVYGIPSSLPTDISFGQRNKYHASFDPIREPIVGTQAWDHYRRSQDCRVIAPITNLCVNPSFETYSGSGNTTNWGNWTESRSGYGGALLGANTSYFDGGAASAEFGNTIGTGANILFSEILNSDFINITTSKTYYLSFSHMWSRVPYAPNNESALFIAGVHFFDVTGQILGTKYPWSTMTSQSVYWGQASAYVYPVDFPPGTTKIQIWIYASGHLGSGPLSFYFDSMVFGEMVGGVTQGVYLLNSHEGRYLPVCSASFAASTAYDNLTLQAMLATSAHVEITPSIAPMVLDLADPVTKFREIAMLTNRANEITIPTHKISGQADKSLLEQIIRLSTDPLNAQNFWYDYVGIIPTDRAYSEVRNSNVRHLILDGRSSQLALISLAGSINAAQILDMTKQKGVASYVADPDGFNAAMLALVNNNGSYEVTSVVDISMVYDPLYLLVPEA